jgi:hypothetical protein
MFTSYCLVVGPNNILFSFDSSWSVGRLIKLLLTFARKVIPSFSLLWDPRPRFLFSPRHVCVLKCSIIFDEGKVGILCRPYICCTIVLAQLYPRCDGGQVMVNSVNLLLLSCTKQHLHKVYRNFLSMRVCAACYDVTYATTHKLQLVSWMVIDLTATKFKPPILLLTDSFLSNPTYIWIDIV